MNELRARLIGLRIDVCEFHRGGITCSSNYELSGQGVELILAEIEAADYCLVHRQVWVELLESAMIDESGTEAYEGMRTLRDEVADGRRASLGLAEWRANWGTP